MSQQLSPYVLPLMTMDVSYGAVSMVLTAQLFPQSAIPDDPHTRKVGITMATRDMPVREGSGPLVAVQSRAKGSDEWLLLGQSEWKQNERDTKFTTQLEVLYRPGEEPDLRFCVYQLLSLFVKDDDLIGYGEVSLLTLITTDLVQPTELSHPVTPAATATANHAETSTPATPTPAASATSTTTSSTPAPAKSGLSAAIASAKQPAKQPSGPSELTDLVMAQGSRQDVDEIEIAVCVKPYIMKGGVAVGLYVREKVSGKFLFADKTEIRRTNDPVFTHKLLCVVPTMVDTELRFGCYEMKQQPLLREDRRFGSGSLTVRELLEGSKARPMEVSLFDKKNSKLKSKLILHGVRRMKAVPAAAVAPQAPAVLTVDSSGSLVVIGSPTNGGIHPSLAALVSNSRDDDDDHKEVIQKVIEVDYDRKNGGAGSAKADGKDDNDKKDASGTPYRVHVSVACKDLPSPGFFSSSAPLVCAFTKKAGQWVYLAQTECKKGTVSPQFTRQLELDGIGRETNVELKFIVYQVEDERRVKQKDQIGFAESTLHSILATPQELPLVNTGNIPVGKSKLILRAQRVLVMASPKTKSTPTTR